MNPPLKVWIAAFRPWAFPASTMPVIVTISYMFYIMAPFNYAINWWYGLFALVAVMVMHAGGNLISDYFDFKKNVDRKETFGSSRLLVKGIFQPKTILIYGLTLLAISSAMGFVMVYLRGWHLLWIGALGVLGAFFYYALKFIALGDLLIFVIYGPLIGLGTAYVMTQELIWNVVWLNIPVAMLVVNILHANNTRDIKHDAVANIKTQAMVLGLKRSQAQYIILALGAYVVLTVLVLVNILDALTLITFISLPLAIRNIRVMMRAEVEKPEIIKNLDAKSAQQVVVFSVLVAIFNVIAKVI